MRTPKEIVRALLRDLSYDASLRERLGITREEIESASRWLGALPEEVFYGEKPDADAPR